MYLIKGITKKGKNVIYIFNMLVFGNSAVEYVSLLKRVFLRLAEAVFDWSLRIKSNAKIIILNQKVLSMDMKKKVTK